MGDGVGSSGIALPSATRATDLEERRIATRRLAKIGAIAWALFVVTDFVDAGISGHPEILMRLLGVRAAGIVMSIAILLLLQRPNLPPFAITACDIVFFSLGSILISLEALLLGGFEPQIGLGIMLLAFLRASLLPSHWARACISATIAVLCFPLTIVVVSALDAHVKAEWTGPGKIGALAYAIGHVLAGVGIGSVGSHMVWRAKREVLEARKLGSYRLMVRIGAGASGDVWLARQEPLDREVALKVLRTRGAPDDELIRRFIREAKATSLLRHPNTIRIIEFGASDDGVFFIAMELLNGVDVESLVAKRGALPASRVIHLARQACGSLAEAHDAGIVHRDVKPANLFVTTVGDDESFLKLLDFGVARLAEGAGAANATEAGTVFGTPAYIAPEGVDASGVDARSDLYSLGAVMYFMLTGSEVFPDKTVNETLIAHMTLAPMPIEERARERGGSVPADLAAVVMRCLAKDPADRPQTARDLDEALRACAGSDDALASGRNTTFRRRVSSA